MRAWREGARKTLTPRPCPGVWHILPCPLLYGARGGAGNRPGNEEESPSGLGCPTSGPGARPQERSVRSPSEATHSGPGCLDSRAPAPPSFAVAQPCLQVSPSPYGPHCWAGACVRPAWAAPGTGLGSHILGYLTISLWDPGQGAFSSPTQRSVIPPAKWE